MRPFTFERTAQVFGLILALGAAASTAQAGVLFSEDFSSNDAGWTLDIEWQISAALASSGQASGNPDPALDHTPTADNGIAGAQNGGNVSIDKHGFYYLTSPVIDASGPGSVQLEFFRWLNSDYAPFMRNVVDVYDGTNWINVFMSGGPPAITDSQWTLQQFDVTAEKNVALQIRFGWEVAANGAFMVSGWNLDDVAVTAVVPEPSMAAAVVLILSSFALRRHRHCRL